MRIIARRTLREFWQRHPDAETPLSIWHRQAQRAQWRSPSELLADYPRASAVGSNRAVFRIKSNDYRLVVEVNYRRGIIFIRFIGTHAEYDHIDAREV